MQIVSLPEEGLLRAWRRATVVPSRLAAGNASEDRLANLTWRSERAPVHAYLYYDAMMTPGSGRCYCLLHVYLAP